MRCLGCHETFIEYRTRTGTADKSVCFGFITDELTEDPQYWTTLRTTYHFENGSWYAEEAHSGDIIDTFDEAGCPEVEYDDSFDPGFDYGEPTGEATLDYSGSIDLSSVFAAASSGIEFGDPSEVSPLGSLIPSAWHNAGVLGAPIAASGSGGTRATVASTQAQFRARGYLHLPVTLEFTDSEGGTLTITLPTNGDWSDWQSVTPAEDKLITFGPGTARMGKYA